MFIGRREETQELTTYLKSPKQENIVIYGRRRIGKSELIKETLRQINEPYIFFQAKETTIEDNINSLSRIIIKHYNLGEVFFKSLEDIFTFLFERSTENLIFVIDEYPFLRSLEKGIDSILQSIIDKYKNNSKIKIVLLGSYIEIMAKLNDLDSALSGRISKMMFVSQMNYQEASEFYPEVDLETKVKYFSIFGGMPYYNSLIDLNKTFEENVRHLIINNGGILGDFIEVSLSKELRKINNANNVFLAIAKGYRKYTDILGQLGNSIKSAQLAVILDTLIAMDLIVKTTPINEPLNTRKTFYEINDNFVSFFYTYIYRYLSERIMLDAEIFYELIVKEDFENKFVPKMFEKMAKEYLIIQNRKRKLIPPIINIGKYWYDNPIEKINGEFDLVSKDNKGYIVYEAKYINRKIVDKEIDWVKKQLEKGKVEYYKLGFFSREGFEISNPEDYYLKTLRDLYSF